MFPKLIVRLFQICAIHALVLLVRVMYSGLPYDIPYERKKYKFRPFEYEQKIFSVQGRFPQPRSGHRIGADSSNFYSFGGYNPLTNLEPYDTEVQYYLDNSFPLFQELWRYNFASNSWHRFSNSDTLPLELASNAMVLNGNVLMVYGGTGSPFGYRCSNQLYICNVNDGPAKMTEIKAWGKFPLPLYGQAVVYHNEYLYTIGGTTGLTYTCDIHRLNLRTFEWTEVFSSREEIRITGQIRNSGPGGRYRHEVAFDGDNIFILGGGTAHEVFDFEDIPTYSITKNCWKNIKTLKDNNYGTPAPRRCHGAAQLDIDGLQQVFITGGYDGNRIFGDLWRLNLKTYQWTCFSKCVLPKELYFHGASVTPEGKLYVFGGIYSDGEGCIRTSDIYTTWLCIPKLSEMCWEAVLLYFPEITDKNHDELISAGLPKKLCQTHNQVFGLLLLIKRFQITCFSIKYYKFL